MWHRVSHPQKIASSKRRLIPILVLIFLLFLFLISSGNFIHHRSISLMILDLPNEKYSFQEFFMLSFSRHIKRINLKRSSIPNKEQGWWNPICRLPHPVSKFWSNRCGFCGWWLRAKRGHRLRRLPHLVRQLRHSPVIVSLVVVSSFKLSCKSRLNCDRST